MLLPRKLKGCILCLDVGFANLGIAAWDTTLEEFIYLGCATSFPASKFSKVYKSVDNIRRCQNMAYTLSRTCRKLKPSVVLAEFPHGGAKSSRAATAMAMSLALTAVTVFFEGVDLFPFQPNLTKIAAKKNGFGTSKKSVQRCVFKLFGDPATVCGTLLADNKSREHIADAMMLIEVVRQRLYSGLKL
jgi:hypothetical protein